jgi:predicted negative regulator of RcsB-dependent stress response
MANHLDLEEQEQLDQLKHFWKQHGNVITWVLIVVLGAFAAWNAYQFWQRRQAVQAAALFDEVERTLSTSDAAKIERVFNDMKDGFGKTIYAQQTGLLVAKKFVDMDKPDAAKSALTWVAEKASDDAYQAIARLRLAALLVEGKEFDAALAQLAATFPASFSALVADRTADILLLQGKKPQAQAEYEKAYRLLDATTDYRRLVEVKLNALGVDVQGLDRTVQASGK